MWKFLEGEGGGLEKIYKSREGYGERLWFTAHYIKEKIRNNFFFYYFFIEERISNVCSSNT